VYNTFYCYYYVLSCIEICVVLSYSMRVFVNLLLNGRRSCHLWRQRLLRLRSADYLCQPCLRIAPIECMFAYFVDFAFLFFRWSCRISCLTFGMKWWIRVVWEYFHWRIVQLQLMKVKQDNREELILRVIEGGDRLGQFVAIWSNSSSSFYCSLDVYDNY
jgi:hypothetical protein